MNENVNVCITPKGDKPILHFSQFDNGRIFTVTVLADDGESAAVLTDLDIEFRLRKTDSHVVTVAPEAVADNVITFKTTEQMCACCGQNIASVVFMQDDDIISSLDILVDIQRDILSGGLTSESDIRNLTTQIEQIVPEVIGDDYYTKTEVDELIADIPTFDPSNYYDKSDVDGLLAYKADADDVYTKSDVDGLLAYKADADDVYTKSDVDGLLDDKLDKIVPHVLSGSFPIATFSTDCVAPMQSITAEIVAVQSGTGTPSPQNVRPISGFSALNVTRTGVNLATPLADNTDLDASGNVISFSGRVGTNIPIILNSNSTKVVFNSKVGGVQFRYALYKNGISQGRQGNYNSGQVIDTSNADSMYISFFAGSALTISDITSLWVVDNNKYTTINIPFGQTVYGGVADVTSGKVVVTHKLVTYDGSENWQFINPSFYIATPIDCRVSQTPIANEYNGVAPTYYNVMTDGNIALSTVLDNLLVRNDSIASVADFKTALSNNPLTVLYELATPIEITTTPETLTAISGVNNVWSDTGDIKELSYFEHVDSALISLIKACMI